MAHSSYLHPFSVMPNLVPFGPAPLGFGGVPYQPWPPGVNPSLAQPIALAAAACGGVLEGIVHPFIHAWITPAFGSFPSVIQARLPALPGPNPHLDQANAAAALGFVEMLKERRATNLIVAEGKVPSALLAQLQRSGQTVQWQVQGNDGRVLTALFRRHDGMTEDGSWLLQSEILDGSREIASTFVQVHQADLSRPREARGAIASALGTMRRLEDLGEAPQLVVGCNDGVSDSSSVVLEAFAHDEQQRSREKQGRDEGPWTRDESQPLSPQALAYAKLFAGLHGEGAIDAVTAFLKGGSKLPPLHGCDAPPLSGRRQEPPDAGHDADSESSSVNGEEEQLMWDDNPSLTALVSDLKSDMEELRHSYLRPAVSEISTQTERSSEESPSPAPAKRPAPPAPPARSTPPPALQTSPTPQTPPTVQLPVTPKPTRPPAAAQGSDPRNERRAAVLIQRKKAELARLSEKLLMEANDYRVKHLPDVPKTRLRSKSMPDLGADDAALTKALGKARSESDRQAVGSTGRGPLTHEMTQLFLAVDNSVKVGARFSRAPRATSPNPLGDMIGTGMTTLIDHLRAEAALVPPERREKYVLDTLVKAATRSFQALPPAQRSRVRKAFRDGGGVIKAVHQARDEQLALMQAFSNDSPSVEFENASRRRLALEYTITALEHAVQTSR
jgi:hypothetical protein